MKGILAAVDEPLVSIDYKGDPHSSSVDLPFTMVLGKEKNDFLKVVTWYDNEWGYSVRVADLANFIGQERPLSVARVALVASWLNQYGGAERVMEVLHGMFPDAPVYTSIYAPRRHARRLPVMGHPHQLHAALAPGHAASTNSSCRSIPWPLRACTSTALTW